MSNLKISQLIVAAGIAAAGVTGFAGAASAAPMARDPLACVQGVATVVTDDNGVQHQACVDSAAGTPPVAPSVNPDKASLVPQSRSTPPTASAQLPTTGTGTGGLVIAAILVGSGSIASLLSRRKSSSVAAPDRNP
jgi:LPXTG-motif cell wall-anchored protein